MPGNLQPASPSGVLPQTLCTAFVRTREYPNLAMVYHDGTTERSLIALIDGDLNPPQSIRTWKLGKRLKASDLNALLAFYEQQNGGLIPFWYYDPFEQEPGQKIGSNWDATGFNQFGRYAVRFRMPQWAHTVDIARSVTELLIGQVG